MNRLMEKLRNSAFLSRLLRRRRNAPEGEGEPPVQEYVDLAITRVVASAIEKNGPAATPVPARTRPIRGEEKPGVAEQDALTDPTSPEEPSSPPHGRLALWWAGLVTRIKSIRLRKTAEEPASETAADAFAWDKEPDEKSARGRRNADRLAGMDARDGEEDGEDEAPKGLVATLRRKPVWIGLAVLAVGSIALTLVLATSSRPHQAEPGASGQVGAPKPKDKSLETQYREIVEKNKKLEEENRKLLAARQQSATPGGASAGATGRPSNQSGGSDGDCSITNKESAAETLKRCIEEYNAASGR